MPVIDSVNRKGVPGAQGKRVTKGPYWLVGPKSGDIKSDFSRLSGIRGKVDQYEITNGAGTEAGSYTITIRPFAERGFPALHRAVGDVAIFRQINGVADPDADVSCLVRKRPYSGSVPLTVGPVDVLAGDRLWVVVENKDASTLKYKIDVSFDLDNQASLDLRFAETKSLVDATTGTNLVTFTRASSGTYVGSDGLIKTATTNEPRFDHDPTTGESLGLLVEEQRVNLLLRSEEFDNASWAKGGSSITPNATTGPDGLTSADKIVESTTLDLHYAFQTISVTAGVVYTLSVHMKAAERTEGALNLSAFNSAFPANATAYFNLSTGTIRVSGAGLTSSAITAFPNGWYRCAITATAQATTGAIINSGSISNGVSNYYTGDGTSGIYLWGAQLEAGSFPTSYIPTTTSTVTRAADVASISGSNFSSWYRQDEGSFYCSTFAPKGAVIFGTGDTFDNTQYASVASSNNVSFRSGGVIQANLSAPVSSTANTSLAMAYATNSFAAVSNGGSVTTDSSGSVPANQVRLKLGSSAWDTGGSNSINGHLRRLTYWPQRLPDSTLQTLTL